MNINIQTPSLTYVSGIRNYINHSRLFGNSSHLLPQINSSRLDTLVLNRGYRLPHISYTCLEIDKVENRFLLAGASNGDIYIGDLFQVIEQKEDAIGFYRRGQLSGDGHLNYILHCDWFKNDAASFITASRDHTVKLWDTENLAVIETFKFTTETESISGLEWNAFEPHLIAVGLSSSVVKFVDPTVGSVVQQIRWSSNHITSIKWYPGNAYMIFAGTAEGNCGIFDIRQSKKPLCELDEAAENDKKSQRSGYTRAKFTEDATKLVALTSGGRIKVFRMSDGELINEIHNFRSRIKKGANFDLCNEGSTVTAFVPCGTEINMISIEPRMEDVENERRRLPIPSKKLYSGFASDAIACVYRPKFQHVIGFGLDKNCHVYTPKYDIRPDFDKPIDNSLHADTWSSDED